MNMGNSLKPSATTGSGGKHLLFQYPEWHVSNKIGRIGHGLDIKGDGGYIIVAPSDHKSGDVYKWNNDCSPLDVDFAQMPSWLESFLEKETRKHYSEDREMYEGRIWKRYLSGTEIDEGTRNDTLFQIGAAMRVLVGNLSFFDHMHRLNPFEYTSSGSKGLESQHRTY
jgi:hypothetical protein